MATLRFTTAGESHGPGLVAIVEGLPAGLELDRDAARPRHGPPPARPRSRRADEDRERLGRDPLGRAARANARKPGRGAGRQPRLRELGGADEPVAGGRGGGGGPHAAPRPRRPRGAAQVRPLGRSQRARARERPRDRRPGGGRGRREGAPARLRRQRAQPRAPDRLGARSRARRTRARRTSPRSTNRRFAASTRRRARRWWPRSIG